MDNITHTLAGLALAEAGLKRTTRLGVVTLAVGANLPDLDGLIYVFGSGTEGLEFRRGWTHGLLAMILLPPLLAIALFGWDRLTRRDRPPARMQWLLVLAALGIWSHPLLDLLNTYGVRLLLPFSGRWFYGDALFIVDPWIWLVLGVGIVLSRRSTSQGSGAARPARVALAACACYAILMAAASRIGERAVERQAQSGPATRVLASPVFANPLRRDVIRELGGSYELGRLTLGLHSRYMPLTIRSTGTDRPGAAAAARTKAGAAFLKWARFPAFQSERVGDSIQVTISDLRYGGTGSRNWASVTLRVRLE